MNLVLFLYHSADTIDSDIIEEVLHIITILYTIIYIIII